MRIRVCLCWYYHDVSLLIMIYYPTYVLFFYVNQILKRGCSFSYKQRVIDWVFNVLRRFTRLSTIISKFKETSVLNTICLLIYPSKSSRNVEISDKLQPVHTCSRGKQLLFIIFLNHFRSNEHLIKNLKLYISSKNKCSLAQLVKMPLHWRLIVLGSIGSQNKR